MRGVMYLRYGRDRNAIAVGDSFVSIAYVMACPEQLMPAMRSLSNVNALPGHRRKIRAHNADFARLSIVSSANVDARITTCSESGASMSNGSACRRADTPPQPLAGPEATAAGQPDRPGGRCRQHGIPPKSHGRVLAAEGAQEQLTGALLTLARGHAGLDRAEPFDLASLARD